MNRFVQFGAVLALVLATLGARSGEKNEATKKDLQSLQGSWEVVSTVSPEGVKDSELKKGKIVVTVQKDKMGWKQEGKVLGEATFRLDASKNPKEIDMTITAGDGAGKRLGIYKLEGDKWTICDGARDGGRPKEFAAGGARSAGLVVLQRSKK